MIISMQGNWTVAVKSKNAAFQQRFMVQGATSGNGVHNGTVGTSVNVTGTQWSIAIQHNPGTGWVTSDTQLKFPQKQGGNYVFDIHSNDEGNDTDFNDLILTCSTPVSINDFIMYGNITLYSKRCIFNPCRKFPFVIESHPALEMALKNPSIADWIKKNYPERIPQIIDNPNPPDPDPYFKPLVFDLSREATKPRTALTYRKKEATTKTTSKAKAAKALDTNFIASNFDMIGSSKVTSIEPSPRLLAENKLELSKNIGGLLFPCTKKPGSNLTLTFEEYDRTVDELSGGAYTGSGNRRLLGDTITDMNGNYIFRFRFDMTLPVLEDAADIAAGEDVNVVMFPDVIVKIVEYTPFVVRYESAPYYNVPNLKRIDLCLPESQVHVTSACFNGNLIGSLGNVFIGGNQNTAASFSTASLTRHGYSNYLEPSGIVSVNSSLAGFNIECAAWKGTIDMKGCMYDATKTAANNKIKWYTIRIRRSGTSGWDYVSQNYKHPKFSKRNLPNYIGDDVGPFYPNAGGSLTGTTPAYINIQREIFVDGVDWEFSNLDRYMRLNTALYDVLAGVRTPGKFYVRVDGYNGSGAPVSNATDLIAIFVHNNGLNFGMTGPELQDSSILNAGCGLYRLTSAQLKTPISFDFQANDPYGFVNEYALSMGRCPGTPLELNANIEGDFTISGGYTFTGGENPANVHHACPGYKGSQDDHSNPGLVNVQLQPLAAPTADGWIKAGEYFTVYSFGLTATQRVTNGYNSGLSGEYRRSSRIMMELLNP